MTAGMETTITGVTVFTDGARVQRTGTADLEPGQRTVVIRGLPAALHPASVRVTARGTDLALLNVETRHGYTADPLRQLPAVHLPGASPRRAALLDRAPTECGRAAQ